jgi:ketosteroid isomerase-like protein
MALALPLPALVQGADVRAEAEKMDQAWQKAYNAGDAAALTALYTKDAKVMAPGAEAASGTKAIQAMFTADVDQGAQMALSQKDVTGFGDYAL